ncbi:hypothetical protein EV363DRAFT_1261855 [Boletus edulis]|nr:hypothetical protein EV363DRAFT_1261855 [Boletus edulis]
MCPARQPDDDLLRTLVSAFLLTVCLYVFKLQRQKRLEDTRRYAVRQDRVPAHIIDKPSDDVLCQIDGPRGQISSLVLLDGGHAVCVCKAEKTIQMWKIEEDRGGKEQLMNVEVAVNVIAPSKDGKWIVTGGVDGKVMVWDTSFQKPCKTAEHHGRMITALDVFLEHVASGSDDGTVVVWKMKEPGTLVPSRSMRHGSIPVSSVKFSPAGNRIASACAQWGHEIRIWHTRTGSQIAAIRIGSLPTHSLAWSSDGRRLFTGCSNGSISCFDTVTQNPPLKVVQPRPGDDSITSLRVSDSNQFLISYSSPGRMVDIWDIRDTPASKPLCSYSRCVAASTSPDDLYLASGGDDRKISIRSLTGVVKPSYFFHRLAPFPTPSEPFTHISPVAYRTWKFGELERAEQILSKEIEQKRYEGFDCYSRANRALVRIRRQNLNGALDDAAEIITKGGQIPLIVHVAKAMALGGREQQREAIDALDSVDRGDANDFVECVKSIILFESEPRDKLNRLANTNICPWVKTRMLLLLAEHSMQRGESDEALRLLTNVPDLGPSHHIPEAEIIQLIFGWNIYDLECMVQQLTCQALFASGRTQEMEHFLLVNKDRHDEENESRQADLGWLCEKLGDQSMRHRKFDDAIIWYSKSLEFYPESRASDYGSEFAEKCLSAIEVANDVEDETITKDLASMARYLPGSARLLVKRSDARAFKELWDDALKDADKAIDIDKLCPWGYERRYVALYTLGHGQEAAKTLNEITKMEESTGSGSHRLRMNYAEMIRKIDVQIGAIRDISPLILICVRTGNLCDANERVRVFKEHPIFHKLLSSMSTKLDTNRIKKVVARYFRYVMFSHTWEGEEPTFQDLAGKSVYEPNPHPLRLKLRRFCETVRDDPERYLWAWSDTCCIDKSNVTDFQRSLRSMYNWYKESAITIVLLTEGSTTLRSNRWMTRAWTLQELLSPKSIRFYNRDWTLYRGDTRPNHKESPDIMQELAKAIDIPHETLADFSPKSLNIRSKLRLASTRKATKEVDIAHALIGIFSSDLIPDAEHPDPKVPLGHLLQEIMHRERDARAVLDWVGKSSEFHSCLPDEISVYHNPPHSPPLIPEGEMEARVAELQDSLPSQDVTTFFGNLSNLSPVAFIHRRLSLPCITFPVKVDPTHDTFSASSQSIVYQAQAAALGQVRFKTSCTAFTAQDDVVLVYPWVHDLLAQTRSMKRDDHILALRLVVHLEQPFRAFLLVRKSVDTYRRVAVDEEIIIPKRKLMSLKDIGTKVLEIR